jgi:polyadenylate-binding protein
LGLQLFPRGRMYRYPPGRNMGPEGQIPGVAGGMIPPYEMGAPPMREMPGMMQPIPIGALATALANANPEQQRTVWQLLFEKYLCKQEN